MPTQRIGHSRLAPATWRRVMAIRGSCPLQSSAAIARPLLEGLFSTRRCERVALTRWLRGSSREDCGAAGVRDNRGPGLHSTPRRARRAHSRVQGRGVMYADRVFGTLTSQSLRNARLALYRSLEILDSLDLVRGDTSGDADVPVA